MAHIRQIDERRWKIWFDTTPDPVTGRRRQRTRTIRGTREDAEKELERITVELGEGMWVDDGSMRLAEFLELFREARGRQKNWAPGTVMFYEQKHAHAVKVMGHRKLSQITGGALTIFYGRLADKGLSQTSIAHVHASLRSAFNAAVKWGYLRQNPCDRADAPTQARTEQSTWTADQLRTFLDAAADTRWLVPFMLLATTGMRRSEVAGLRWAAVDLKRESLIVREALTSTAGHLEFGPPKTRKSIRSVALDPDTVALLAAHRRKQITERMALDGTFEENDLVVAWEDGRPVNPEILTKNFRRISSQLDLPRIRLHDLRHTWATLALTEGIAMRVVSERLGHASFKITADTYTHVVEDVDRDAAARVARAIRG